MFCVKCGGRNITYNDNELFLQGILNPNEQLDIENDIVWVCVDCCTKHNSKWINSVFQLVEIIDK